MKHLSVCSGIEAASQAWHDLGWQPIAFSEIERFPCQVLARHYPDVPNLGDMTRFKEWTDELLAQSEILVGGPPCQAFSIAGIRESLDDARGNLSLTYVHLLNHIDEKRNLDGRPPAVCLWENVPGVLSTHDNAFGCLLGGLAGSDGALEPPDPEWGWTNAGYVRGPRRAVAWRVLDAQYFGLAQRRRRVFVVASARGLPFCPAKVLFEPESLRGNPSEGREAGQRVAPTVEGRAGRSGSTNFHTSGGLAVARSLRAQSQSSHREDTETYVTHTLKGEGFDASEDGTGRGIPLVCGTLSDGAHNGGGLNGQDAYSGRIIPVPERGRDGAAGLRDGDADTMHDEPIAFYANQSGDTALGMSLPGCPPDRRTQPIAIAFSSKDHGADAGDTAPTLRAMGHMGSHANGGGQVAVAFQESQTGVREYRDAGTLRSNSPGHDPVGTRIREGMAVRRLTPMECERLQGFPDGYTLIPAGKGMAADGPRYKALGNSMAVPCMAWIGKRIDQICKLT